MFSITILGLDKNPLLKDSEMVMNFEEWGNSDPVIMFETGNNNEMVELKKSIDIIKEYNEKLKL